MLKIAHNIKNVDKARQALNAGANILEVDVAQSLIFERFTTQHQGVLGKLGIGSNLLPLLKKEFNSKLLFDLKHPNYSFNFFTGFYKILRQSGIKNAKVCGKDWQIVTKIAQSCIFTPYYTIAEQKDFSKVGKLKNTQLPVNFTIRHNLLNSENLKRVKADFPHCGIYVWIVNNIEEVNKLKSTRIEGVIVDNYSLLES